MEKDQYERFEKFIFGNNMDFYEEYTINLSDKEQKKYLRKTLSLCLGIRLVEIRYTC